MDFDFVAVSNWEGLMEGAPILVVLTAAFLVGALSIGLTALILKKSKRYDEKTLKKSNKRFGIIGGSFAILAVILACVSLIASPSLAKSVQEQNRLTALQEQVQEVYGVDLNESQLRALNKGVGSSGLAFAELLPVKPWVPSEVKFGTADVEVYDDMKTTVQLILFENEFRLVVPNDITYIGELQEIPRVESKAE